MRVYLVQHGDAVAKDVDPQRPLSERGRADVERVSSFLDRAGTRVSRVLHSGKRRAEQTAELLSVAVAAGRHVGQLAGIDPLDPPDRFGETINGWIEDTLVVGHLPFMARLVAHLVLGDEAAQIVEFQPGTVVCLLQGDGGGWSIAWMIRPELLGDSEQAE